MIPLTFTMISSELGRSEVVMKFTAASWDVRRWLKNNRKTCSYWALRKVHYSQQCRYPLVICYIAMERSTIFNGKIHYKWPFSIAMLVYQRVLTGISDSHIRYRSIFFARPKLYAYTKERKAELWGWHRPLMQVDIHWDFRNITNKMLLTKRWLKYVENHICWILDLCKTVQYIFSLFNTAHRISVYRYLHRQI